MSSGAGLAPPAGDVRLDIRGPVAHVTLSHPGKFNAMSRAMWARLREVFEDLPQRADVRCVLLAGEGGQFCAGGDISEYAGFRFDAAQLSHFHENEVWGGLNAMLACDLPIVAQIEGHCMGAGLEMASCCDIRIAGASARFGAPIARLGFPMAPREAALLLRVAGDTCVREMLLEAAVLPADVMLQRGFLTRVAPDAEVAAQALASAGRITELAPAAARMNKQGLRALGQNAQATPADPYAYADSAEHREGIGAFTDKRRPRF